MPGAKIWMMTHAPVIGRHLVEDLTVPGLASPDAELRRETALWLWVGDGSARDLKCKAVLLEWMESLSQSESQVGARLLEFAATQNPPLEDLIAARKPNHLNVDHVTLALHHWEKIGPEVRTSILSELLDSQSATPNPVWSNLMDLDGRISRSGLKFTPEETTRIRMVTHAHAMRGNFDALRFQFAWRKQGAPKGEELGSW